MHRTAPVVAITKTILVGLKKIINDIDRYVQFLHIETMVTDFCTHAEGVPLAQSLMACPPMLAVLAITAVPASSIVTEHCEAKITV